MTPWRVLRGAFSVAWTAMSDPSKVGKNLRAFQIALNAHDRENPTHNAWGIGLAHFDMERLGFDEGEEILPGITIQTDGGVTGNFRVLCDGDHEESREQEEAEVIEAVGTETVSIPAGGGGGEDGPGRFREISRIARPAPTRGSAARGRRRA